MEDYEKERLFLQNRNWKLLYIELENFVRNENIVCVMNRGWYKMNIEFAEIKIVYVSNALVEEKREL